VRQDLKSGDNPFEQGGYRHPRVALEQATRRYQLCPVPRTRTRSLHPSAGAQQVPEPFNIRRLDVLWGSFASPSSSLAARLGEQLVEGAAADELPF